MEALLATNIEANSGPRIKQVYQQEVDNNQITIYCDTPTHALIYHFSESGGFAVYGDSRNYAYCN